MFLDGFMFTLGVVAALVFLAVFKRVLVWALDTIFGG